MISKTTYTITSYQEGLGDKRSLAEIIPAKMETEHNGSTYSICFGVDKDTGNIILQTVKTCYEKNMMPTDKSFKASKQQASVETQ
jgi:hypothetical protein